MHSAPLTPFPTAGERELVRWRLIDASRERVFDAWIRRLPEWWGPHGMHIQHCELDPRPGGIFRTVMRAPDGTEYTTRGVFLEITRPERIIFTDAFDPGWQPREDIFLTAHAVFESLSPQRTKVTARALHWTAASRDRHEAMGFHPCWGESLDRLAALVAPL